MILKRTSFALALAVLFLGTAAALAYAQSLDLIGPDAAKRTMQVMSGLILAAYSNLMPKDVGPWRASPLAVARSQSALRVGGWSMTLAGLAYAGLYAFAPLAFADIAAMVVVASAMVITMGYGGWTLLACRSHTRQPLDGEGHVGRL
jgi:hypothetical protein